MKLRVLVVLLAATGCAQPEKVTANNCEVVAYQSVSGEAGYTSGINRPPGQYGNFAEFVLVDDNGLIKQRNWEEATAAQQFCRVHVMFSKSPAELERLDEAAQGKHGLCGNEYAAILDKVRASWQPGELQAQTVQTCGAA
jgi:hypothetical protein